MPTLISDKGKWYAAKETVNLVNLSEESITSKYIFGTKKEGTAESGEPFIYRGPDREAIKLLNEAGAEHLGGDFRKDPEFRQAVRNQGFENVDAYLKDMGYDEEEDTRKFKEKAELVEAHQIPKVANEILVMGGGQDRTGNKENTQIGGFGDQRERKPAEVKAAAVKPKQKA